MDVNAQLTDNAYIAIWNDIANGGTPFWVLLSLLILFYFKDEIKKLFSLFINILIGKVTRKVKSYKQSDLKKHQLFKDLDYWLTTGIDAIHLTNSYHDKDIDYIKGKEQIAKDVARIKFETIKETFTSFINDNDFNNIDYEVAHQYLLDTITKTKISEIHRMLKAGIPNKFIEKYEVFCENGNKIVLDSIKLLYQKDINFDVPTRVYISLSNIDGYLNISFNSIAETINSINGDLIGEEYNGHILGHKKKHILRPPSTQNNMAALDKLSDILKEFQSARASVSKIYGIENDDYTTGYHSCVYEVVSKGVMPELENIQSIPNNLDSNVMLILSRYENIAVDISKFSKEKAQSLLDRGVVAVILSPIFNNNKLDGILSLDYFSLEDFNKVVKMNNFDEKLNDYSNILASYIIYPNDYKF